MNALPAEHRDPCAGQLIVVHTRTCSRISACPFDRATGAWPAQSRSHHAAGRRSRREAAMAMYINDFVNRDDTGAPVLVIEGEEVVRKVPHVSSAAAWGSRS